MRIVRRVGGVALTTFIVGALLAVPAQAQTPESFAGSAKAHALKITLLGTDVTVGGTEASADSTPHALAKGAGIALLGGTASSAEVSGVDQSDTPPEACLLDLPLLDLLRVSLACSESKAQTPGSGPNAVSTASIGDIDLTGMTLLGPIIDQLTPVVDQTLGTVTTLLDQLLGPLVGPLLGNLDLGLNDLVGDLLDGLERATGLLRVQVGNSASSVTSESGAVTAHATSQAAQIDLLPGLTLGGDPLVSIIVGDATATSTYDRDSGESAASFDPALARVRLGIPLLGGTLTEIPVTLGAPLELLAGTPLAISISVGGGRTVENDDGTVGAVADGLAIHLLNNLIGIELAHAETAAGGALSAAGPPPGDQVFAPVPDITPVSELAKTGTDPGWIPIGGFGLLLMALFGRHVVLATRKSR